MIIAPPTSRGFNHVLSTNTGWNHHYPRLLGMNKWISQNHIWVRVKIQSMDQGPGPTHDPYSMIHTPLIVLWFAAIWAGGCSIALKSLNFSRQCLTIYTPSNARVQRRKREESHDKMLSAHPHANPLTFTSIHVYLCDWGQKKIARVPSRGWASLISYQLVKTGASRRPKEP